MKLSNKAIIALLSLTVFGIGAMRRQSIRRGARFAPRSARQIVGKQYLPKGRMPVRAKT